MEITRYDDLWRSSWDNFIVEARNGTFQFMRNYLDHHGQRFQDHSLIFLKNNRIIACIAGHVVENTYHSHMGLSFGGLITKLVDLEEINELIQFYFSYLRNMDISSINIRTLPSFMHTMNENINYLFLQNGAKTTNHRLTMLVSLHESLSYTSITRRVLRKLMPNKELQISRASNLKSFYLHMHDALQQKYGISPLHSYEELSYLSQHFSTNISCWEVSKNGKILAGACLFHDRQVVKLQYLFSSESNSARLLLDHLFTSYNSFQYFDMGSSNSLINNGLNFGNHYFKQSMGGKPFLLYNLVIDL